MMNILSKNDKNTETSNFNRIKSAICIYIKFIDFKISIFMDIIL